MDLNSQLAVPVSSNQSAALFSLQSQAKEITIVGGGLAGLTLGIALRQEDIPVTLWEKGHYPRHRVCGEFISGQGQETLRRLDLLNLVIDAGGRQSITSAFFLPGRSFQQRLLPQPALCVARFNLDAALAKRFAQLGGELRCGVKAFVPEKEGIVRATGRRTAKAGNDHPHWFGVKAHVRNVTLIADLEMHVREDGYVGLCQLQDGVINACGLLRREKTGEDDRANGVAAWLRGPKGSLLYKRLKRADFDESSFCAVGGLDLTDHRAGDCEECCIGDSITMIPPVTGNGMSMAFESAEVAVAPLVSYARGGISWEGAGQEIAQLCDARFGRRLRYAKWLQRLMLCAPLQSTVIPLVFQWDWCWQRLFRATR